MLQNKVEDMQHQLNELREDLKKYVKEHLPPEVLDLLKRFVDRCDTILNMHTEINDRYDLKLFQRDEPCNPPAGDQETAVYLLSIIKKKLSMLEEARMECVLNGTLEEAEHDFCTLEKAYLELKVDLESFIRLQELKRNKKE